MQPIEGRTPLMVAIINNEPFELQDVTAVDSLGRNALMYAALFGRIGALRALLALPEVRAQANKGDRCMCTALHLAAWKNQPGSIAELLAHREVREGINIGDRMQVTPLACAIQDKYKKCENLLRFYGAGENDVPKLPALKTLCIGVVFRHGLVEKIGIPEVREPLQDK